MKYAAAASVLACLASCQPAAAQDLNVREFRRVVEVGDVSSTDRMPWYAGESVGYTVLARSSGRPVQIPAGSVPVWQVLDAATNAYVVVTGSVVSATNGEVRFWLPAPQANLPPGDYLSFASVYQGINRIGVLDRTVVRVSWRPGDEFEVAQPSTNAFDLVMGIAADLGATLEVVTGELAEAVAGISGLQESKLDAAAAAELYQPAGSYLTEETDAIALAQAPTNVVCAGGWYWPDYFDVDPIPRPESYTAYGTTSAYNSVLIVPAEHSTVTDYLIQPVIARQQDWTSELAFSDFVNVELSAQGDGKWLATWLPETEDGSTGSFYATLGDFSRQIYLIRGTVGNVSTSYLWVADLPGSLRASINSNVLAAASDSGKDQAIYSPWPYAATNFIRNTNCWAAGFDLTCASPWNSDWKNYKAGTAVTPQHIIGAAHFFAPTGSVFRFIDATNGVHERTLVDRRFLPNDVAVGLLNSPLGSQIKPATVLSAGQIGYLRGKQGLRNAPGIYLVTLDAQERAWLSKTPLMESAGLDWSSQYVQFTGSTNLPFSRYEAVGGDSGNPIFAVIGTNAVLLSCFYTATSGPFHPLARGAIEAAMADMGGSAYTTVTAPDLSAWTNYDAGIEMPDF